MPTDAKFIIVTFDFERVISSLERSCLEAQDLKAQMSHEREIARAAVHTEQPWSSENDETAKFENAEISRNDIVELATQFEQKFEPALIAHLEHLISGRSFSGRRIDERAGVYAYLTASEVEEMTALLSTHYEESFNLLDKGAFCKVNFDSKLVEVMESMLTILQQANGFDLFITTA